MMIDLDTAAEYLQKKKTPIAIPTETVYGLAACIDDEEGIKSIYALKNRPLSKPLSIQISDIQHIKKFTSHLPPKTMELAQAFWPGPMTLILPAKNISPLIRADLPTIGIRIPDHPLTLKLIQKVGPIVAPSANYSGKPPALSALEVEKIFGKNFPVLDGGICSYATASTILSFDSEWKILRQGPISP